MARVLEAASIASFYVETGAGLNSADLNTHDHALSALLLSGSTARAAVST